MPQPTSPRHPRPVRLTVRNRCIVGEDGRAVHLKGVNLGGWLMMEGYILHSPNRGVRFFEKAFRRVHGQSALAALLEDFRSNFVRRDDLQRIASWGFNCVRVPFHHRLIGDRAGRIKPDGAVWLDRVVRWCRAHGLWAILDCHAAYGAQNHDWHSDSDGRARLWRDERCRRRTIRLWEALADRYKDDPAVGGFDVLNEPVTDDAPAVRRFYRDLIRAIRRVDRRRLLFVEGNNWALDLKVLQGLDDEAIVASVHFYHPLEYTFSFVPNLCYPLQRGRRRFDKDEIRRLVEGYVREAERLDRPLHVGEFGVHYRFGAGGEDVWVRDLVRVMNEHEVHWNYWTYKAVKNEVFPDGLLSYYDNPPWVHREGPLTGWEMYAACWPNHRQAMARSWRTASFELNARILHALCP